MLASWTHFEIPALADNCLFKGGTSLSKVFHIIDRFSEDIDIGITPSSLGWRERDLDGAPSRTKRNERISELESACAASVQNIWMPLLESRVHSTCAGQVRRLVETSEIPD